MKNSKKRVALVLGIVALAAVVVVVATRGPAAETLAYDEVHVEPWGSPPAELVGRWLHYGVPVFVINADGTGTVMGTPVDGWHVRDSELMLAISGEETTVAWNISDRLLTLDTPSYGPLAAMLKGYSPLHWRDMDGGWELPPPELIGRWLRDGYPAFSIYTDGTGSIGDIQVDSWWARGSELMLIALGAETTVTWSVIREQLTLGEPSSGPLASTLTGFSPFAWHDVGDITFLAIGDSTMDASGIDLIFSASVSGLTADQIVVTDGIGSVVPGAVTGGGMLWSVDVDVSRVGNVFVTVYRPGITSVPRTVAFYLTSLRSVSAGEEHIVALRENGSLWAWGINSHGRLGDGTTTNRHAPTRIDTDANLVYASAGYTHTVAIGADGSIWAWGQNDWGQLGGDAASPSLFPVRVYSPAAGSAGWTTVSAGREHTVALRDDGSLWAWGRNLHGQLGDGTTTTRRAPTRIGTDSNWASVSAGRTHTVATRTDGSLWIWGANWTGQLGTGMLVDSNVPVRVGTDSNWASVSAGRWHTVGVRTDGSLWAWGGNGAGQLGDGTTTNRHSPTRVGAYYTWASASAGSFHTVAVRTDGSFMAWGRHLERQFDAGAVDRTYFPTRMASGYYWAFVSAGWDHTAALRMDGSLWLGGIPGTAALAALPAETAIPY